MNIITYIITLVVLVVLDSVWLFTMGGRYKEWLGHLFSPTVNFVPAVIFYFIYVFGLVYFVIAPGLKQGSSMWWFLLSGALFGLVAYATYDLTNHATMKDWPLVVTLLDIAWGSILTGVSSVIIVFIVNYFK